MWHKFLITLASACPLNPIFPVAPEYIGPQTRGALTCIIEWHIKNNLAEFSALAKSVWGIYTPFNSFEGFLEEFNKAQIVKDPNQHYKLDFRPRVPPSGFISAVFKPSSMRCIANNRSYGKIKNVYEIILPSELDFDKVQRILQGCLFKIPPDLYDSIIDSQKPETIYNEFLLIISSLIVIISICISVVHQCSGKNKTPVSLFYREFISILFMIIPFIVLVIYVRIIYVILIAQLFILFLYFKLNRKDFNWPKNEKELYTRQSLSKSNRFEFINIIRVALAITVYITITAVDFITFSPLMFKSKHQGYSFMDIGEGFYVLTAAIVSPMAKEYKLKTKDAKTMFKQLLNEVFILFIIGILRSTVTKLIGYRIGITEYGYLGNFFIVMSLVRFVAESITYVCSVKASFGISLFITLVYEFVIYRYRLDYILSNNPRDTIFLNNIECILNIVGLLPLYLFGYTIGWVLMTIDENQKSQVNSASVDPPKSSTKSSTKSKFLLYFSRAPPIVPTPSKSNDRSSNWGYSKIAFLSFVSIITMLFYVALGFAGIDAWRAMSNLRYNMFTLSIASLLTLLSLVFTIYYEPFKSTSTMHQLNENSFYTFLYANVMTGLINTVFQTKLLPMYLNAIIIFCYSLSFIIFSYLFNGWKNGTLDLSIPECTYETIYLNEVEVHHFNLGNTVSMELPSVDSSMGSSRKDKMNSLRDKLGVLRTKIGKISNE